MNEEKTIHFFFRRFLYNNADKTEKWAPPEYNTKKEKKGRWKLSL